MVVEGVSAATAGWVALAPTPICTFSRCLLVLGRRGEAADAAADSDGARAPLRFVPCRHHPRESRADIPRRGDSPRSWALRTTVHTRLTKARIRKANVSLGFERKTPRGDFLIVLLNRPMGYNEWAMLWVGL